MNIQDVSSKVKKLRGRLDYLKAQSIQLKGRAEELSKNKDRIEEAKEIVKLVGLKTQSQLSLHISGITSLALESVMDNPYSLQLEFLERRDKTECDLLFVRDDLTIKPMDGGGGPLDIASFALRVASWSMQTPRSRNVLILDEPFKHLKGEAANRRMLEMLSQVSKKLNLQIIMVSDERVSRGATIETTDALFEVRINNKGISKITKE